MTLFIVAPANEFDAAKKMAARGIPFAHEKTVWRGARCRDHRPRRRSVKIAALLAFTMAK
jgi:hypothetical protein